MTDRLKHINEVLKNAKCLVSLDKLNQALDLLAARLNEDMKDKDPIINCVMKGGLIFFGQLLLKLKFPHLVDFLHVTRYTGEFSGGNLAWLTYPRFDMKGRQVILVDDILEGGVTLEQIKQYCIQQGAKDVKTVVMLSKKVPRVQGALKEADYVGLEIEDHFVFGFGLDYEEYLRHLPGIYYIDSSNINEHPK